MKKFLVLTFSVLCLSVASFAQPRPVERTPNASNSPPSIVARYEGGSFGRAGKETGTLKFDDANERVVFFRGDNTEMFHIPYDSLLSVFPDSKKATTGAGNVISHLPLPGAGLASLSKSRTRYVILEFDDQELEVRGNASFKVDDKMQLRSFVDALGTKARMTQRGDAYYRPRRKPVY